MNKAEVARELKLSRTYVGYLVQGRRNPEARTLEQFRALETSRKSARDHGRQIETGLTDLEQIYDRIATMKKSDPPNFEVIKKVVESLSPVNSKQAAVRKRLLNKAVTAAQRRSRLRTISIIFLRAPALCVFNRRDSETR